MNKKQKGCITYLLRSCIQYKWGIVIKDHHPLNLALKQLGDGGLAVESESVVE